MKLEHLDDITKKVIIDKISEMASSVYYYQVSEEKKKVDKYEAIKEVIDYLYIDKHKKRMGYQRIHTELVKLGYHIGKNKVNDIMREKGYLKIR
ncbi:MAG: IS3 family transposase, partial [Acholeplasma sp.]|nr:IS3 family transposase [Acholeplasma sp.]